MGKKFGFGGKAGNGGGIAAGLDGLKTGGLKGVAGSPHPGGGAFSSLKGAVKDWWQNDEDGGGAPQAQMQSEEIGSPGMLIPNQGIIQRQPVQIGINPYFDPNRLMRPRQAPPQFAGFMKRGGRLEPGEVAVVGDGSGPEMIQMDADGAGATVIPNPADGNRPPTRQEYKTNIVPPPDPNATVTGGIQQNAPTVAEEPVTIPETEPAAVGSSSQQTAPTAPVETPVDIPADASTEDAATSPADRLIKKRKSDETWTKADDLYDDHGNREKSLKNRLFGGLSKGNENWYGQGGIVGWIASALGGGIGSAVSPGHYDKLSREVAQKKLFRQASQEMQHEQWNANQDNLELKPYFQQQMIDLKQGDLQRRVLKDENDFYAKLEIARKKAEAEGNKYKVDVDEETGRVMRYFPNDPTRKPEAMTKDDGTPWIRPSKLMYDYADPLTGQVVKVNGGQVLATGGKIQAANIAAVNAGEKTNVTQDNIYQQKLTEYENKKVALGAERTKRLGFVSERQSALDQLNEAIKNQGFAEKPEQLKTRLALEKEITSARNEADGYTEMIDKLKPPPKPTDYTPKTTPGGKYANRIFPSPSALKQWFPGKTEDEIRRKVEANGGRFEK